MPCCECAGAVVSQRDRSFPCERAQRARVRTYNDTLLRYRVHPEPKSLSRDGQTCTTTTSGPLTRRPVTAESLTYIGKEANDIDEITAGIGVPEDEALNTYADPADDE
jgi:hypothetical protein